MERYNRYATHSVYHLSVHLVWVTKYRYHVLSGDVQLRARELLRQICDANDVSILKGVVSRDHVHMHVSYPPRLAISEMVRKLKGRSGRKLLQEFPSLKKRYWGGHFWAIGYGAWSSGNITEEMINEYLEHHRHDPNDDQTFILE
jgi:putative transposase